MAADPDVAVIGGGPAGLFAAELLSAQGLSVTVYDRMPTVGRKFLMAGRGGLNLTHSEDLEPFVARYGAAAERLRPWLEAFPPQALVAWAESLGQSTFVGSSGRVFPRALKASPLLRAWLARLAAQGVTIRTRAEWRGWNADGTLLLNGEAVRPRATVLALGGASWPKLGSNGAWAKILAERGAPVAPFQPANCGFDVVWSEMFKAKAAGEPLKAVALTHGRRRVRGEALITQHGLEGGAIYALSAALRDAIATDGSAVVWIDLRPETKIGELTGRLAKTKPGESLSNRLRKALHLSPAAIGLLREAHGAKLPTEPGPLARAVKGAPITLTAPRPIGRAISTAGGLAFSGLSDELEVAGLPNVFAAGEMLDWEAPTGGYLLQATFATARIAAQGVLRRLG